MEKEELAKLMKDNLSVRIYSHLGKVEVQIWFDGTLIAKDRAIIDKQLPLY